MLSEFFLEEEPEKKRPPLLVHLLALCPNGRIWTVFAPKISHSLFLTGNVNLSQQVFPLFLPQFASPSAPFNLKGNIKLMGKQLAINYTRKQIEDSFGARRNLRHT